MALRKNAKWTPTLELFVSKFYKSHPLLWDTKKPDYKKYNTSKELEELSLLMGEEFTVEEIMKQFATMRKDFFRNLSKVNMSRAKGSPGLFIPKSPRYKALMFLRPRAKPATGTLPSTARKAATSYTLPSTVTKPATATLPSTARKAATATATATSLGNANNPGDSRAVGSAEGAHDVITLSPSTSPRPAVRDVPLAKTTKRQKGVGRSNLFYVRTTAPSTVLSNVLTTVPLTVPPTLITTMPATAPATVPATIPTTVPEAEDDSAVFGTQVTLALREMDPWTRSRARLALHLTLLNYDPNNPNRN